MPKSPKSKPQFSNNVSKKTPAAVGKLLQEASQFHQKGQLEQALSIYQTILAKNPQQADALHLSGVVAFQQKRPEEAIALLQKALKQKPDLVPAYNNLGLILAARNDHQQAIVQYDQAIKLDPQFSEAFYNKGIALFKLKQYALAESEFKKAIALKPHYLDAHYNLGNCYKELNQLENALASYQKAITDQTTLVDVFFNCAGILFNLKRFDEALSYFPKIFELKPNFAEAYNLQGIILKSLGKDEESLQSLDQAIQLNPNNYEAYNSRGATLEALKRDEEALASFEKAVAIKGNYGNAYHNLAVLENKLKRKDSALANFEKAVVLKPKDPKVFRDRGVFFNQLELHKAAIVNFDVAVQLNPQYVDAYLDRAEVMRTLKEDVMALKSIEQAIAVDPQNVNANLKKSHCLMGLVKYEEALISINKAIEYAGGKDGHVFFNDRGVMLIQLQKFAEAREDFRKCCELQPDQGLPYFNLSLLELLEGDFENGWRNYDYRLKVKESLGAKFDRKVPGEEWRGEESLAGKTIAILGEQGMGDSIQFSRYVSVLGKMGAKVILDVQRPLVELLKKIDGVSQVLAHEDVLPPFDYHCSLLSLPLALKTTLDTIPPVAAPLNIPPERISEWQAKLGPKKDKQLRVGLVWSGSASHKKDHLRSITLAQILEYLPSQCEYISLHKEFRKADVETLIAHEIAKTEPVIRHFENDLRDFIDTAALCQQLDLVISVDTSVAHLAGTLSVETWVLLPSIPDWRWLLERTDTPWYPSMRLFRQKDNIDSNWEPVLKQVQAALLERL